MTFYSYIVLNLKVDVCSHQKVLKIENYVSVYYSVAYKIILESDSQEFGGFGRLNSSTEFRTLGDGYAGRENSLMVYIPARTAFILARKV